MQPADLMLRNIILSNGAASVFDVGAGLPVIFVHGYPGRPQDFRWLVPLLPSIRAIGIALPGLDHTPLSTEPDPGVPTRGQFLSEVLDALGVERCVMAGHSMGGVLAAEVATRQPERVIGLALLSSIGLTRHRSFRNTRPRLATFIATAPILSTAMRPLIEQGFRRMGFPPGVSWPAMQHTLRCAAAIDFAENRTIFEGVQAPTFMAWTQDDPMIEEAVFEELSGVVPDGPRMSWKTGGHASVKKRAAEIADGMVPWLGGLAGAQ